MWRLGGTQPCPSRPRAATHNAASIDLVADDGQHVQVKTVGTIGSLARIKRGRDVASQVMVITTFGENARFFLLPMERFKALARTYNYPARKQFVWEINGHRISGGVLNEFEIEVPDRSQALHSIWRGPSSRSSST
jgi:hypothetical protein